MVVLKDFLGIILSDLTNARVQADIESVRMAELYSTNKILRNFAVPRVRFQNVEITTPIVIDKIDEDAIKASRKPLTSTEVRSHVSRILESNLEKNGVKLDSNDMAVIKKSLHKKSVLLEKTIASTRESPTEPLTIETGVTARRGITAHIPTIDTKSLADEFTKEIETQLKKLSKKPAFRNKDINKISSSIKTDLRARLSSLRPPPPSLQVLVNTAQVREAGPKEVITMLKFVINEDAMEWTEHQESTGEVKEILVPE